MSTVEVRPVLADRRSGRSRPVGDRRFEWGAIDSDRTVAGPDTHPDSCEFFAYRFVGQSVLFDSFECLF